MVPPPGLDRKSKILFSNKTPKSEKDNLIQFPPE